MYRNVRNRLHQDNQSTIQLIQNGRSNIQYFFLHNRVQTKDVDIVYLSITEMIADILTKPLQGELFKKSFTQPEHYIRIEH